MSAVAAEKRRYSLEEYLEMERVSLEKHEFFDGEIFAMAGARPEHNLIVANLLTGLNNALGDKCVVYAPDQRLHIHATGLYTYADASLVCCKPVFNLDSPPSLLNPEAIFEVLSSSTESYDRGNKFENYRTIPTLQHYVLLAQDKMLVEHFTRQAGGRWLLAEVRAGERLQLPCGDVPIEPLYRWVLP